MYNTPQKDFPNKITSLREKIESKLQTDKNILDLKQNIFTKYQSHTKNYNQNNSYHNPTKDYIYRQNKQSLFEKEKQSLILSNENVSDELIITENNILEFQSLENRNFYGFEEWLEFNKKFFFHVDGQTIKNLWKIMRTINYGDIWIPSGLIYEVSKVFTAKENVERISLKQTFNQFLKFNHATDQVNNFRELKNYPSFEEIQKIYLKINKKQRLSSVKKGIQYSSLKKLPSNSNSDVFKRANNESKVRNEKKNRMIYQSLIEKQMNEECVFKPKINQYCPQKLFIDETEKLNRTCQEKERWMRQKLKVQNFTSNGVFKATPFERSRFDNASLDSIPGVSQYIDRKRHSQSQKRKLQRYKQRPSSVYRHDY